MTADVEAFLRQAVGKAPTLAATAAVKRVTFEARTFLVTTLRQQVERGDGTQKSDVRRTHIQNANC